MGRFIAVETTVLLFDCQRGPLAFASLNSFGVSSLYGGAYGLAPLNAEACGDHSQYLVENMERETGLEPEDTCFTLFQRVLSGLFSLQPVRHLLPCFSVPRRLVITRLSPLYFYGKSPELCERI